MDVSTLRTVSCVDDPAFMGNYTNESSSPSHLLTSTIADELKIATRNEGLVYAIAPFRDAAILQQDMPEMAHSGSTTQPENGVERPIIASSMVGKPV